jgi:hypothetical protein
MSIDRITLSNDVSVKLSKILGINRVRDIVLSFHMDELASAKVTFLLNDIQANAIVQLLGGTKWGQSDE